MSVCSAPACRIEIVDDSNGWPVPLVELETTHHLRFVSDNAGLIAIDAPELLGVPTWFHVRGHGYGVDRDGFGYEGIRVTPVAGQIIKVRVKRKLPAKRIGRLTGGGLFAESQKLGERLDWREQRIFGCDSVQNAVLDDRLFWIWGDTTLAKYPLGRFHSIGATTPRQPVSSLRPPLALRYDYFVDADGVPDNLAEMSGDGPTWLFGLITLPDEQQRERLGATYSKIKDGLIEYEKGLCVWNRDAQQFDPLKVVWRQSETQPQSPEMPYGHAVFWTESSSPLGPWSSAIKIVTHDRYTFYIIVKSNRSVELVTG